MDRMEPTDLTTYFSPDGYSVIIFGESSFVTLQSAADLDRLPETLRTHDRNSSYFPYYELKNGRPEIYASEAVGGFERDRWITLNAARHDAEPYLAHPEFRLGRPWVLLRRL